MLVLSRQRDESIMIGDDIEVEVVQIRGDKVRLGVTAPRQVSVDRREVAEAKRREHADHHATTHGMHGTAEYRAWQKLKDRCLNPNSQRYDRYGGRGIRVCDRWLESFENFFADV